MSEQQHEPAGGDAGSNTPDEQVIPPGRAVSAVRVLPVTYARRVLRRGRRSKVEGAGLHGHAVRAVPFARDTVPDVAIVATLEAAARRLAREQGNGDVAAGAERPPEGGAGGRAVALRFSDLRVHIRRGRTGTLVLFVVDASGSMAARKRMVAVKGAMLGLLTDAYQKRDRVALIAFRGEAAELLVPPTNSVELAERRLRGLPTGGRTPLAAGLARALQVIERSQRQDTGLAPLLVLVTDGRSNVGPSPQGVALAVATRGVPGLVLDSEQGFVKMGEARRIAHWLGASYLPLDQLTAETIQRAVRHFQIRSLAT